MTNEQGELLAFCSFGSDGQVPGGDYGAEALDIGIGMRPDLTGQGQGFSYVQTILNFAKRTFNPPAFRVTIAEFNIRARRVWEKSDFKPQQRFQATHNTRFFVVLTLKLAGQIGLPGSLEGWEGLAQQME